MNLTRKLRIGNGDWCCFCKNGKVAGGPIADVVDQNKLEGRMGVVDLEAACTYMLSSLLKREGHLSSSKLSQELAKS